jgi:hypothetical protein
VGASDSPRRNAFLDRYDVPALMTGGLGNGDARALLDSVVPGRPDSQPSASQIERSFAARRRSCWTCRC